MKTASYDPIGNAYFSLVIHVPPRRFERLLVVTSEFHIRRTDTLFRWIYGLAGSFLLHFEATSNDGIDVRRNKDDATLRTLPDLSSIYVHGARSLRARQDRGPDDRSTVARDRILYPAPFARLAETTQVTSPERGHIRCQNWSRKGAKRQ
jgi:hypothetical protein